MDFDTTHFQTYFPYILLSMSLNAFAVYTLPMLVSLRTRHKIFNDEFMELFHMEHGESFNGAKPEAFGYPDQGNGRYSKDLTYGEWYHFNNA